MEDGEVYWAREVKYAVEELYWTQQAPKLDGIPFPTHDAVTLPSVLFHRRPGSRTMVLFFTSDGKRKLFTSPLCLLSNSA